MQFTVAKNVGVHEGGCVNVGVWVYESGWVSTIVFIRFVGILYQGTKKRRPPVKIKWQTTSKLLNPNNIPILDQDNWTLNMKEKKSIINTRNTS